MPYEYHAVVLGALARHGVRPTPATPPELVHEYVSDLYRYELRRLRARLAARQIPKEEYAAHVVALRRRYALISMPARAWAVARAQRDPASR